MSSIEESFIILGPGVNSIDPSLSIINNFSPDEIVNSKVSSLPVTSIDSFKSAGDRNTDETFASKFLLGKIDQEELKSSVFKQFPSINTSQIKTDDVLKLYSLLDEHAQLKDNIKKTNDAMRHQYNFLQKWQDRVRDRMNEKNRTIEDLQLRLNKVEVGSLQRVECVEKKILNLQENIEKLDIEKKDLLQQNQKLRGEIIQLEESSKITIQCLKSDNYAHAMSLSEEDSLIRNTYEQIHKMEQEKRLVAVHANDISKSSPQCDPLQKPEYDQIIRELNQQLSEVTGRYLELQDMQRVYKDEIDCLKVNLVSAEELQKQMKNTIITIQASNTESSKRCAQFEQQLSTAHDRIDLLSAQVEIYRNDFQMEREAREKLVSEKDILLNELSLLQKRNKELLDKAQNSQAESTGKPLGAIRKITTQSKESSPETEPIKFICPLCELETKTLRLLEQHLELCLKD